MTHQSYTSVLSLLLITSCVCAGGAQDAPPTIEHLFNQVASSVVTIRTEEQQVVMVRGKRQAVSAQGIGSGVLISDDGKIMTAAHVVQTADQVTVTFLDDTEVRARVIASEPLADVALLQLIGQIPTGMRPVTLGDSDTIGIGARVIVVGAPRGMSHSLTVGYLSARRIQERILPGAIELKFLQTDASINRGNSGGPMFNLKGEVIGIVSYILSESGGSEGLGFAVASNSARGLLLEQHAFWGGIEHILIQGDLAAALNVPSGSGALVQKVAKRSPASLIGIRGGTIPITIAQKDILLGGDIVLEVQGVEFIGPTSRARISTRLSRLTLGEQMQVKILRGGKIQTLSYTVDERMLHFLPATAGDE